MKSEVTQSEVAEAICGLIGVPVAEAIDIKSDIVFTPNDITLIVLDRSGYERTEYGDLVPRARKIVVSIIADDSEPEAER